MSHLKEESTNVAYKWVHYRVGEISGNSRHTTITLILILGLLFVLGFTYVWLEIGTYDGIHAVSKYRLLLTIPRQISVLLDRPTILM